MIVQFHWLLKLLKSRGIPIFGFLILILDKNNHQDILHEKIHLRQQWETLIIFWYIIYLIEWIYKWIKIGKLWDAYYQIKFEREAFTEEIYPDYLKDRKLFNWIKY